MMMVNLLFTTVVVYSTPAAYLSGSIVKCHDEGKDVIVPVIHDDPCYRCRCLDGEIVCFDTCTRHKKCNFNGKIYKHNESWNNGTCTKCSCNNGNSSCKEETCSNTIQCNSGQKLINLPGECCPTCVEVNSQCKLTGLPFNKVKKGEKYRKITTFDGLKYDFNGKCNYVLARDCENKGFTIHLVQDPYDSSIPRARHVSSSSSSSSLPSFEASPSSSSSSISSYLPLRNFADTPRDNLNRSVYNHHHDRSRTRLSPSSLVSTPYSSSLVSPSLAASTLGVRPMKRTRRIQRGLYSLPPKSSSVSTLEGSSSNSSGTFNAIQVTNLTTNNNTRKTNIEQINSKLMSVSIVFKIGTTKVRLTPTNGPDYWKIRVGRKSSTLPFIKFGTMTIIKDSNYLSKGFNRPSILIWTNIGIKITWNGEDDLNITMPIKVKSSVCGLCGNYNGDKSDDLLTKKGHFVKSINKFIETWKVGRNGYCPDNNKAQKRIFRTRSQPPPLID